MCLFGSQCVSARAHSDSRDVLINGHFGFNLRFILFMSLFVYTPSCLWFSNVICSFEGLQEIKEKEEKQDNSVCWDIHLGIIYFNVFFIFMCFESYSLLTICLLFLLSEHESMCVLILTMHGGLIRKKQEELKAEFSLS